MLCMHCSLFRHIAILSLSVGALLIVPDASAQIGASVQSVAMIAHPGTDVDTLTQRQILDLYTLEKNKWEDGSLVYLLEQKNETEAKLVFYDYIRKKPRDLKKIWMRAVLSGEGRTPKVVRSQEEVVQSVSEMPGALGYVNADLVTNRVKILAIIPNSSELTSTDK